MTQIVKSFALRAMDRVRRLLLATFPTSASQVKLGSGKELSDSEKTPYAWCIESIAENSHLMKNFRRIFIYREVVETVSYPQGKKYLTRIKQLNNDKDEDLNEYKSNDLWGNPITYKYPNSLKISPTTLRYISVSRELRRLFGTHLSGNFVEIGAGYGGQAAILMRDFDVSSYSIFDLPNAKLITSSYLKQFKSSTPVRMCELNETEIENFDLVVSNYAFSELPSELQDQYITQVLKKSECGYLIMNSGKSDHTGRQFGKHTLDELRGKLPPFEVYEELPHTGPDNYVIVWGHERVGNQPN